MIAIPTLALVAILGAATGWIISRTAFHLPEVLLDRQAREWAAAMGEPPPEIPPLQLRAGFRPHAQGLPREKLFCTVTALGAVALAVARSQSSSMDLIISSLFLGALLVMSIVDQRTMLLPDILTGPFLWAGLLVAVLFPSTGPSAAEAITGAAVGYVSLAAFAFAAKKCSGREIMGRGDPRLLAGIGAWCGFSSLHGTLTIALAAFVLLALLSRLRLTAWSNLVGIHLAFGPPLALGGAVAYLAR